MQEDVTSSDSQPEAGLDTGRKMSVRPGMVVAVLLVVALIAFVVQNGSDVPVKWLFIEVNGPLWAVIVVSAVAGAVLAQILGWLISRRRRRRD